MGILMKLKLKKILTDLELSTIETLLKTSWVKGKIKNIIVKENIIELDKAFKLYSTEQVSIITQDNAAIFESKKLNRNYIQYLKKDARIVALFFNDNNTIDLHIINAK